MYNSFFAHQAPSTSPKIYLLARKVFIAAAIVLLAACHSHNSDNPPATYSIGGGISGLSTTGLVLQNNAGDDLAVAANASSFEFATRVAAGGAYNVTVATQPPEQACIVSNGSGSNVSAAVTTISVVCSPRYAIDFSGAHLLFSASSPQSVVAGGSLSLTVTAEANYTKLDTVGGTCAAGTWAGNVYTTGIITADCTAIFAAGITVGGSISGLTGTAILIMNGTDNLSVSSNGAFTFLTPLAEGSSYNVTVGTQPAGQTCSVTNGSAVLGNSNVTNVAITCSTNTYTVTTSAGANGNILPASSVVVNSGANQIFTATPSSGYTINQWLLDNNVVQAGGTTYQLSNIQADHTVRATFIAASPRFAYVGNLGSDVIKCDVNASTSALSNCAATGSGFLGPVGIAINSAHTLAYIANLNSSSISQCSVDSSTGTLSACTDAGATSLNLPLSITLNSANAFAYIANLSGDSITQCAVDSGTGALSSCVDSGATSVQAPQALKLNAAGTFAYIATASGLNLVKCSVNAGTGALGTCAATGAGFNGTDGIEIDASGTVAYVANSSDGTISKCNVSASDGELSGCATAASGFNAPASIILNRAGTVLYVENFDTNTVSQCAVDQSTADLTGCVDSGATGLNQPFGIELYY